MKSLKLFEPWTSWPRRSISSRSTPGRWRASAELVSRLSPEDLANPTPCAQWTLRDLLAHLTAQNHGFAAAAKGDDIPGVWEPRSLGERPMETYRRSADDVLAAFGADDVRERQFSLPEFGPGAVFAAPHAISFHFVDYVVHSWDLAKSLGTTVEFEPEILDAAMTVAKVVPDDASRLAAGATFGPAVPVVASSDGVTLEAIVAHLGRSPAWPA